jgi:phosphatidylserine decarboxylase
MTREQAIAELTRLRAPSQFHVFEVVDLAGERYTVRRPEWFGLNHRTLVLIDESKGHSSRILLKNIAAINVLN